MVLVTSALLAVYGFRHRSRQGRARGENQTTNSGPGHDTICDPMTKVYKGTHYHYEILDLSCS